MGDYEVSEQMKPTAMEYWKHIEEWAKSPPKDQQDWNYAKLALGVVKTYVQQQAVENNRGAISISRAQALLEGGEK